MHKTYFDLSPAPISDFFQKNPEVNRNSRRDPEFFIIQRTRLFKLDKTLYLKGPRLYNLINNKLRRLKISLYPEHMALVPYKLMIRNFLLNTQKSMVGKSWELNTLPLYSVIQQPDLKTRYNFHVQHNIFTNILYVFRLYYFLLYSLVGHSNL